MPDKQGKISIRGLDPELYSKAMASATGQRPKQSIGQWINDAMDAKLKKEKRKGER